MCVSVSVTELLATASQRHVVPLQGRPYEEDQVTGMLTVEFLFTGAQAEAAIGASHSEARTVVTRPVGSIMKQPSSFMDEAPNDNLLQSDNTKKGFSPYFDYTSPGYTQTDLKPVSRSGSKNRKTMFAEPLETPCDPVPNALLEISNCQNPVTSSSQNNVNGERRSQDLIKYLKSLF